MDGRPLFDLSQLLEYYYGEKEATETILKKIPDRFIRVRMNACVLASGPPPMAVAAW